jgi:predicted small integral membrane protein
MTIPLLDLVHLKALYLGMYCLWLVVAVFNNIMDFGTNRHLLGNVLSMRELKTDPILGKGLSGRAIDGEAVPTLILRVVIVIQIIIVLLMARGVWHLALSDRTTGIGAANLSFAGLFGLWFWFLIGGLWHGYWMKMPQVQQVHFAMVLLTLGGAILINLP